MKDPTEPVDIDDVAVDAALRDALSLTASSSFADAVLVAHGQRQRASRAGRRLAVAAAFAVVGLSGFLAGRHVPEVVPSAAPDHGSVVATARTTTVLPGAIAVMEPGTRLSWQDGGASLESGEAFFRVEPVADAARPFIIHTAGGDVVVRGTCVRIRVSGESTTMSVVSQSRLPSTAAGTVVGAVLGAAVTLVIVDEGRVTLRNAHGAVDVAAGEQAQARSTSRPELQDAAQRERRRQAAVAALASVRRGSDDVAQLQIENERLRAVVAAQEEELSLLDVDRRAKEGGEPRAFPADLPERFTEGPLRAAFEQAIIEAGVDASVTSIDCSEYPCMVWGRWAGDTRELDDTLKATPAFAAYADDAPRVYGWGTGDGPEVFAVALTPRRAADAPPDEELQRRIGHRARETFDVLRAEEQKKTGDAGP